MSTSRMITRLAAATAAGVVLAAAVAAPAFAEDVIGVGLSGVPSSFTAGARADSFAVSLRNNSDANVVAVTVNFTVQLNGLTASQVRIRGVGGDLAMHDSGGQVVATDPRTHDFGPKSRLPTEVGYSIEFLTGAPSGKATLTATAVKLTAQLGSASSTITVKGGAVAPSPSKSATPTDPATPDTGSGLAGGPAVATAPLQDKNQFPDDGSGGIPVGLYIMGALLVGVGGVILWMLFRQRPQAGVATDFPTGEYDPPPPSLGYPVGRASATPKPPINPTTPLPAVRVATLPNPHVPDPGPRPSPPPPKVDPWANPGGGRPWRHSAD